MVSYRWRGYRYFSSGDFSCFVLKNTIIIILCHIVIGACCFFLGRLSIEIKEKIIVEYKDTPAFSVTFKPTEIGFTVPEFPKWIFYTDTITETQKIDTAAILHDWIIRREYAGTIFDIDTIGKATYQAFVQYNQLDSLRFYYTLKQKQITHEKVIVSKYTPFVYLGLNTQNYGSIGGGLFVQDWGLSVEYGLSKNDNYWGVKIFKKF